MPPQLEAKVLKSTGCWAVSPTLSAYSYEIFSSFRCGELTPEDCPRILDTPCITDNFIASAVLTAACNGLFQSQKLKKTKYTVFT